MIVRKHRKRSYKETKEILQKKRPWLCQHSAPSFGAKDSDDRSDGGDMDGKELEEMPEEDRQQAMNQFARRRETTKMPEDSEAKVVADALTKGTSQAMLKYEKEAKLPERSGQVKRVSASWLTSWQWRWLVLRDRRLAWFDGPQMKKLHGVIDFDLVEVEIERLWDNDNHDSGSSQPSVRRGKERGCRSVCISSLFSPAGEVAFRLLVAGSNRAFEMCVSSKQLGEEWIQDILEHLEDAARRSQCSRLRADQLNVFNYGRFHSAWWKVSRISPETFKQIADSGDILLFKSQGTFPRLIRAASRAALLGGRYDHVGLILKLEGGNIALLEATGNEGVGLCTWANFLANSWEKLYPEMALRRVRCTRSSDKLRALQDWVSDVYGKPYNLTVGKLQHRGSTGGDQKDFFCSQLVAEALKVMGVIPRGQKDSAEFWPDSFSAKSPAIECAPGCSFDPEDLTIDFDLSHATAEKASEPAKRDATVSVW
ncbi:unnamed protein product [Durusdinium trenchii]|uniref:PH domain-containing protein n=1 Tax=Durusdinium trenchii TaxID=1381693 RepID=A0ABP0JT09_9DINO